MRTLQVLLNLPAELGDRLDKMVWAEVEEWKSAEDARSGARPAWQPSSSQLHEAVSIANSKGQAAANEYLRSLRACAAPRADKPSRTAVIRRAIEAHLSQRGF
jgi:hypothetical protein